jgi:hypothetical protein
MIDRHFQAGLIYILYGERRRDYSPDHEYFRLPMHAYKIGLTERSPQDRIKEGKNWAWIYQKNIHLIHQIDTDNMRVLERMCHEKYRNRLAMNNGSVCEWFCIDEEIEGICTYKSIYVNDALKSLAVSLPTYTWWKNLSYSKRRKTAKDLWYHKKLRINQLRGW